MRCTARPARPRLTAALGLAGLGLTLGLTAGPAAAAPTAGHPSAAAAPHASAVLGSELSTGQTLGPGDAIRSPSGAYLLAMTPDGELLLEKAPNRLTPTPYAMTLLAAGTPGSRLVLQADGNLVGYQPDGAVFFDTGTARTDPQRLVVQDDRNVVLYRTQTNTVDYDFQSYRNNDFLTAGGTLLPGEQLTSLDNGTTLLMQTDGNLVLYRAGRALFASGSTVPGSAAVLQGDGNLVVYTPAGLPAFSTASSRPGMFSGVLRVSDGEFRVFADSPTAGTVVTFGSAWRTSTLEPGQSLLPGDRRTAAGNVVLVLQEDGNLVEYVGGRARFATGTAGDVAIMQPDGNLVVYRLDPALALRPTFSTRTNGFPGSRLVVQSDGNLVVYTPSGRAVYASQR